MSNDKALIESLGGPAKLAERLGYPKEIGPQRVSNWITRGIPSKVKVDHPDLFLRMTEGGAGTTEKAA